MGNINERPLTNNQKLFCQEYIKIGMNATKAYMTVYKTCKTEKTAGVNASRLLENARIQEYIQLLQKETEKETIMSVTERKEWLTNVINGKVKQNNKEAYILEKLKALDILNKMDGEYTSKVQIDNPKATKILSSINKQLGGKSE